MADIIIENNQYIKQVVSDYMTPQLLNGTIQIASFKETIIPVDDTPTNNPYFVLNPGRYEGTKAITVIAPNSAVTTIVADNNNQSGTYIVNMGGLYRIRYQGAIVRIAANGTGTASPFDISFYIAVARDYDGLPRWNIATVIDRVLDVTPPHLANVPPKYKLDPAQAAEFEKIEAPEFAFTKMTLKGILDQIGGFIHGIPRLVRGESGKFDTIRYDMLGGTEQAMLGDPKLPYVEKIKYVTEIRAHNIENYATELDSTVDNFVNTLDSGESSVTEPRAGGYKTVRSEQAFVRIEEGNMVISTQYPVYSVQALEIYFLLDGNQYKADITSYLFEYAEYGRLSSYDGVYPSSKAHAIYYEQGQKNIKGLNYKSPTVINGVGAKYSIANIITDKLGVDISAKWWEDANYTQLMFRVTYTPIFSARVLQSKSNAANLKLKRTLTYNQAANLVETRYYGENLKGTIARMGNPELTRTYLLSAKNGLPLIPKMGQLWDDEYYVSSVTNELYFDHDVCTIGLSKDFNRLSQYIGINSEWRAYEVSEKSAYNRDFVYRDYIVIGGGQNDETNLLGSEGLKSLVYGTLCDDTYPITAAVVTGYSEGIKQSTVSLPVISTAFGTTIAFAFNMADNFSAGDAAHYVSGDDDIKGYWQSGVQYTDYYGRLDTLEIALKRGDYDSGPLELLAAFLYPDVEVSGDAYIATTVAPIEIKKDSREILRLNYQLEYVADPEWSDIIIGSALTHKCPFVRNNKINKFEHEVAALYFLTEKVGKFQTHLKAGTWDKYANYASLIDGAPDGDMIEVTLDGTVNLKNQHVYSEYAAWAIANSKTKEIYLARNINIPKDSDVQLPTLCVKHDI